MALGFLVTSLAGWKIITCGCGSKNLINEMCSLPRVTTTVCCECGQPYQISWNDEQAIVTKGS